MIHETFKFIISLSSLQFPGSFFVAAVAYTSKDIFSILFVFQMCRVLKTVSFKAPSIILEQQQKNFFLYSFK